MYNPCIRGWINYYSHFYKTRHGWLGRSLQEGTAARHYDALRLAKTIEFPSKWAATQSVPGNLLSDRPQQQHQFRGDDREQIVRARSAAEALFAPKPQITEQPVSETLQPPHSRRPRVLPILPPARLRQKTADAPAAAEQPAAPEIPCNKRSRVRTLVKYGMSVSQVADLYRVPAATIERILRKA